MMPSISAGTNARRRLALAVAEAAEPYGAAAECVLRAVEHQTGCRDGPDAIPGESPPPSSTEDARVFTLPLAQAMTIMLLPVNSSAPPTTTRIRPTKRQCRSAAAPLRRASPARSSAHRRGEDRTEGNECAGEDAEDQQRARDPSTPSDPVFFGARTPWRRAGLSIVTLRAMLRSAVSTYSSVSGGARHANHRISPRSPPPATDDLHRDDLHDRHRRKDHRIADVRPFGRRHPGRIDQDGRIAGCARSDADEIVVRESS